MGRIIHLSLVPVLLLLFASLLPIHVHAGWSHDPAVNTAITTQGGADQNPAITDDGAGGAIIAWSGPAYDIYIQRIDAGGNLLWGANGKAITSAGNMYYPQLVSDGSGGAIITWQGSGDGSGNIYAQRVDEDGNALWRTGGEIICNEPGNHQNPQIVVDGIGGAVIAWQDRRNDDLDYNIYAQSIRSDDEGDLEELWPANGLDICIEAGHQYYPQLVGDGSGGVIVTWQDGRDGWDVYAQRIDADGYMNEQWVVGGVVVAANDNYHEKPQIVSDGSGGAIITWQDMGSGGNGYDVYAQRIGGDGAQLWTAYPNGLPVSTGINNQQDPQMVSDGAGGAIIAWWGIVSGGNPYGIYAQRINGSGTAQWSGGVTVATPSNIDTNSYSPQIAGDGNHGAVITWADQRNGSNYNVYAQRIQGTDGAPLWTSDGAAVSTAANHQQLPKLIADGSGGAIITWQDVRSGDWNIYAQKVLADGSLPVTTVTTATPVDIEATTATVGGVVTSVGGAPVTARGVCWSTSAGPTITDSHTSDGSGTGAFSSSITGLTPSTPYHVRAYATNSVGTSYGSDLQFTTLAGSQLTVNLIGSGGGGGRVTSDSWGIDCAFGQCLAFFTTGSQVTLTATPDGDSIFGIWGGDCFVTNGKCVVTMNGATKNATATFNYVQPVRILGSTKPFTLIGSAYADPGFASGGTIQARVHEFTENLNFNRSISAIIKGGYDTAYHPNSGLTTVKGTVTVTSGSVTVENLAIR